MINPSLRFVHDGTGSWVFPKDPKAPCYKNIWDWDQLRLVKVKGTSKLFPMGDFGQKEAAMLAPLADYLAPEVRALTFDDDGLLFGVSIDREEDETFSVPYLTFSTLESFADCRIIQHSKLQELDRLVPGVDLSTYEDESGNPQRVAFKFNPIAHPINLQIAWTEINLLKSLPPHPSIVLFDLVVLEDIESRVIGFTMKYIPSKTLHSPKVPVQFEWIQQLTQVADFLNLKLGIMHQDIAPENLLIDTETHKLLLINFGTAVCGEGYLVKGRDDVTGVVHTLYQLITNDTQFMKIPHSDRTLELVQSMPEWPCNRELDSDISTLRKFLNEWVATRKRDGDMNRYLNAPSRLTWPELPTAPEYGEPINVAKTVNGDTLWKTKTLFRRTAME